MNNFWDLTFSHVEIKTAVLSSYLGKTQKGCSPLKSTATHFFTRPTQFQNVVFKKGVRRSSLPGSHMQLWGKYHYSLFSDNKIIQLRAVVTFDSDLHKNFQSPIIQSKFTTQGKIRQSLSRKTEVEAIRIAQISTRSKGCLLQKCKYVEGKQTKWALRNTVNYTWKSSNAAPRKCSSKEKDSMSC